MGPFVFQFGNDWIYWAHFISLLLLWYEIFCHFLQNFSIFDDIFVFLFTVFLYSFCTMNFWQIFFDEIFDKCFRAPLELEICGRNLRIFISQLCCTSFLDWQSLVWCLEWPWLLCEKFITTAADRRQQRIARFGSEGNEFRLANWRQVCEIFWMLCWLIIC